MDVTQNWKKQFQEVIYLANNFALPTVEINKFLLNG